MTSPADVARFQRVVAQHLGLRVEEDAALRELDAVAGPAALYVDRLERDPGEQRALASRLVVGETYFYRHKEQLAAFAEVALPEALARAATVRVLSAGCSTGEEAYTLAMVVRERWPEAAGRVEIVGVDLNAASVATAARGLYTRWSLRATPPAAEARWFRARGGRVQVADELRAAVRFEHGSVLDAELWGNARWHVAFFRNVLMYFTDDASRAALTMAARGLADGGSLFLGHAETTRLPELELRQARDAFFYRKRSQVFGLRSPGSGQKAEPGPISPIPPIPPISQPPAEDRRPKTGDLSLAFAHYQAGLAREEAGDLVGAVHYAELACALDPALALAHLQLGCIARRVGDLVTARVELDRALALLPTAVELGGIGRAALIELARRERAAAA